MGKLYSNDLPNGKVCCTCKEFKIFENFNHSKTVKDGYRKQCQPCRQTQDKKNRELAKLKPDYDEKRKGTIQCKRCGEFREVKCLRQAKSRGSDCLKCNASKSKEYFAQPKIKAIYSERTKRQLKQQGGIPNLDNRKGKTGEQCHRWKGGKPNCLDCGKKLSVRGAERCQQCAPRLFTGANNRNWKGSVTKPNEKARKSEEARKWRTAVFERDNFTCQLCKHRGSRLHAHHKKDWAIYKDLRFELDNGATLCKECHLQKAHSGWWGNPAVDWDLLVRHL